MGKSQAEEWVFGLFLCSHQLLEVSEASASEKVGCAGSGASHTPAEP